MSGQGSAGNVISALASFFIPGLGQLMQGRLMIAIVMFVLAGVLWVFELGRVGLVGGHVPEAMPMVRSSLALIPHLWSGLDAALWKRKGSPESR